MSYQIVKLKDKPHFIVVSNGLVPKGEYDNLITYDVGDMVTYNNSSYVLYATASAGTLPTDDNYWQEIGQKGGEGATGATGPKGDDGFIGSDGDKCGTFKEFCDATDKVKKLDYKAIREDAINKYSLDVVGKRYEKYFKKLMTLWGKGWYAS